MASAALGAMAYGARKTDVPDAKERWRWQSLEKWCCKKTNRTKDPVEDFMTQTTLTKVRKRVKGRASFASASSSDGVDCKDNHHSDCVHDCEAAATTARVAQIEADWRKEKAISWRVCEIEKDSHSKFGICWTY